MKLTRCLECLLLAGGLLSPGCRKDAPAPAPPAAAVSPPVDLGAVIRQVHFSFREEGGAFRAGHPTHAIAAGRGGQVELTAYVPARGPGPAPRRGGTLALRTVEISRRSERTREEAVRARLRDDGALALLRGAEVEHLVNTARGLHQSWELERSPEGRGDLLVRLAVSGAAYQGETAEGLHFRDPGSPAGLRYGHAVWIDARGERTPVRARWSPGEIALRVPAAVVDRSSFPAVLDPYVSPEIQTDTPIVADAYGTQGHARVSTNGANYLVVWDDSRDPSTGTDIMGARLSLAGALLDPSGFMICNWPGEQRLPAVADDNGAEYFVVWQDDRNQDTQGWDLYGTIVPAATGLTAPVAGTPLVANPGDQTEPAIAFDGTTATNPAFFSAWTDTRAGAADVYGAHLERDGGIREAGGFVVSNAVNGQGRPAVAHDGSLFVVAWQDARNGSSVADVFARRVSSTDTTLGAELQVNNPGAGALHPSVAGGSSYALVAWTDYRDTSRNGADVWGEILAGGVVQAPGNFAISDAGLEQAQPSVAFDGSRFGVVWEDWRAAGSVPDIYGTVVSTAGVPVSLAGAALTASGQGSQLASGASSPLLVYSNFTPLGGEDVYARVLQGFFSPDNAVRLSSSANTQGRPAVGFDSQSQSYLVVWEDNRTAAGSTDLWGVRVSAQGQVLDPSGLPISVAPGVQQRPAVAGGAGTFAVAWEDYRFPEIFYDCNGIWCRPCYEAGDIYGTIVYGDGGVLAPSGIGLSDAGAAQLDPAVAFHGQGYLVAWADDRESPGSCSGFGGPHPTELYAAWLTPQGEVVKPKDEQAVTSDPEEIHSTRLASLGDLFLLGWQNRVGGRWVPIIGGGTAAVMELDGGLRSPPQALAGTTASGFTVAADRAGFWTAWQEDQPDGGMDVMLRPLSVAGGAGAVVVAAGTAALEGGPALAFDGRDLVLAFHATLDGGAADGIYVEWLDDTGALRSPGPVAVSVSSSSAGAICAASDGQRRALVAYQKYDPGLTLSAQRVRSNLVQLGSQDGASCGSGATCFSGFCVDGVCCESACGGGAASGCLACSPAAGSPAAAGLCRPRVQGTVCRAASAGCLEDATCDGSGATCPPSAARAAGAVCRDAQDACDARETCDGASPDCPADEKARDGTRCGDTMACQAGVCGPVEPVSLYDSCAGCSAGPAALVVPLAVLLLGLGRRRRRGSQAGPGLGLGLWVLLLALPLTAGAAGQKTEKARPKLAFLGITATTGVAPEMASSFSEYVQSEVTALQVYNVIGLGEIRQVLGLERQRQLVGCSQESSCAAEMVGALDAERAIFGDVARLGDSMVLNVSLMDLRRGKLLSRVSRRVPGSTVEPLLDVARPVVYELLRPDPALEGRTLSLERGFGGLRVGLRADADVAGTGLAPGLCADVSTRFLGGGVTVLYGNGVGVRAEGRLYPLELDRVRPYAGAGATLFVPAVGPVVGLRGVAGAEVRLWSFSLTADVAYERFLTDSPLLRRDALLVGAGLGYLF